MAKAFLSIAIFSVAYFLIASEKINKTIVAVMGAALVLFLRLVTFEQAVAAIDFNVIFLLVGMMICVRVLSLTGFFEWIAITVAQKAKGHPFHIMIFLLIVTASLSAFLDNVTTIILLVPVSILIMQLLSLDPVPLIILEAIFSNLGGTATLIGDPPNIIIGSQADLSFNAFLFHLGPIILVILAASLGLVYLFFRNKYHVREQDKKCVTEAIPHLAITDRKNMLRALIILGFVFAGFFLHAWIDVAPGIVALFGGMVMLLACKVNSDDGLKQVEWGVIFFFIGMFMMISALEVNGVIDWIGNTMIHLSGQNLFVICLAVLWGAGFFSAILDNIPFVITMIPLVKHFAEHFAEVFCISDPVMISQQVQQPLFWALALGACLGGNGTLIGASANIVMAKIGDRNNYHISFMKFLKYGIPFFFMSLILCSFYLWLRYFSGSPCPLSL